MSKKEYLLNEDGLLISNSNPMNRLEHLQVISKSLSGDRGYNLSWGYKLPDLDDADLYRTVARMMQELHFNGYDVQIISDGDEGDKAWESFVRLYDRVYDDRAWRDLAMYGKGIKIDNRYGHPRNNCKSIASSIRGHRGVTLNSWLLTKNAEDKIYRMFSNQKGMPTIQEICDYMKVPCPFISIDVYNFYKSLAKNLKD